ncbi:pre-rRNA-processing protein ESF1 [Rhodotorula toruloides]|uniref:Pre-rRNA-processing protein ESF1 n=1 Tax=Rhodotorula toruloides TaxID=5286 RepID=A0A511KJP4_RHOTO|nr:pre-rRNA-processing protein ESF1 [Rhodotorula toruloides]
MSDPRFARLHTDPRFVRPKANKSKLVVDDRFKQLFEDDQPTGKKSKFARKVDKYGRPVEKEASVNELKRYYRLASPEEEDEAEEEDGEAAQEYVQDEEDEDEEAAAPAGGFVDYARGQVLLESSDEDGADGEDESDAESDSSSAAGSVTLGGRIARRRRLSRSPSIDLSETEPTSLFPDEDDEAAGTQDEQEEGEDVEATRRIALVNLDWDHLRASDLYRVLASCLSFTAFAPQLPEKSFSKKGKNKADGDDVDDVKLSAKLSIAPGRLLNLRIYPSQFGRERMEREAVEGPPVDVLRSKGAETDEEDEGVLKLGGKKGKGKGKRRKDEDDEFTERDLVDEQLQEGEDDYDTEALRKYQLERLRYYYAIATFDSAATAQHVYHQINGTEFERTANMFDLQFVPDETSFDDDPVHDEATESSVLAEGSSYAGLDFQTDALRHSKVKLTWDADDPHRKTKIQTYLNAALDRSKQKGSMKGKSRVADDDIAQYLASSSEEDEEEGEGEEAHDDFFEFPEEEGAEEEKDDSVAEKKSKKLSKRERLRSLLGLSGEGGDSMDTTWQGEALGGKKKRSGADGEMQITFAPALSERSAKQLDLVPDEKPETSLERYKRKEKERKERKKAERKARTEGRLDSDEEEHGGAADFQPQGDDKGFDDDFFADDGEDPFAKFDAGAEDSGDEIDVSKKGRKNAAKLSKKERRAQREAEEKANVEEQAQLALFIGSDDEDDVLGDDAAGESGRHFDMRQILKAEKNKGKKRKVKGKKGKKPGDETETINDNFKLDLGDERFKSLHEDFDFAIDPSNPRFQKSRNMEALLAEGRKRRSDKQTRTRAPVTAPAENGTVKRKDLASAENGRKDLSKLVEAVKRKAGDVGGRGKRTKTA